MRIIIIMLIASLYLSGSAQTIGGYIIDKETGEKLIGANVYDRISKNGTATNAYGYYSLYIDTTNAILQISYIGYATEVFSHKLTKNTSFQLKSNTSIQEVVVIGKKAIEQRNEMSVAEIPMKQLKTLPMLAGEVDIIKAMQLMPGIRSGNEGQSGMFVRGGSHDQNLMLLDDVPLYYINHLGGFVSVFNPDAINSLKMYKGGFPARYGGRLASIMDVRMKDGNLKKRQSNITFGMISSKFQTEGPIKKDTASYMISGRRFMYDLFSRPITWLINDKHSKGYTFYDLNAKFNYKFSDKNRLFLSLYMGNDNILSKKKTKENGEKEQMSNQTKWGNHLLALRWNHVFNQRFIGNITANYTNYRYASEFKFLSNYENESKESSYLFSSGISDFCIKSDFELFFKNYTIRFGSNQVFHTFSPNRTYLKQEGYVNIDQNFNTQTYQALENSIYLENDISVGQYLGFNIGVRALSYAALQKQYNNLEPRILINFNIPHLFSIKASYARMQQYVHLLIYSGAGLPGDLWMPTTKEVPPQKSELISLGIAKSMLNQQLELSVEAYYKKMNDLIDYQDGASLSGNNTKNWQQLIETGGKGYSKGIELLLQKKQGKINGWLAYTLSRSTRQFEHINKGREYIYTYDATHDFSITSNYYFKDNLYFSASWVYTSGRAITLPNQQYQTLRLMPNNTNPNEVIAEPEFELVKISTYNEKNNIRMHAYHRLDLGLTYIKQKKKTERIWCFSIYNAYNRQNAYYYYTTSVAVKDENGNDTDVSEKKTYQRSLFPFIPSVSYSINF
ncbi:MAG: TonB-dependent receptor [Salinivirgaceae bacterium]|nr:TonB-dependent receptor [Salinivirgaceae bacterium]